MKAISIFIVFLVLLPSKIRAQDTSAQVQDEDMSWNVANVVDRYYYTYFEYPHSIEDLECYLWSIVENCLSEYVLEPIDKCRVTNLQYQDFVTASNSFINTLKYLMYNKKNIIIKNENNSFDLRCLTDGLFVNYTADICWDLNNKDSKLYRSPQRLFFYGQDNKVIRNSEYDSDLTQQIRNTRNYYYRDYIGKESKGSPQYVLIRYTKGEKKFKSLCPLDKGVLKHGYLKEIFKLLNIFFKDKEVCSAVLLLPVSMPENDYQ